MLVGPADNQDTEAFEDAMQTNFWGPFFATREVLPGMKRRGLGRIVNIASIGGKVAFPQLLPYSTSKFALVGYSEGLRAELTKHNVLVTTVCPGLMRTGSPRNADFTGQAEKEYAWFTISDSLLIVSVGARSAARKIIDATVHGDADIHLGLTAKLGAVVQGCAPGLTAELMSPVDRMLPDALPGRSPTQKGADSESSSTENLSTSLTREAEVANNQLCAEVSPQFFRSVPDRTFRRRPLHRTTDPSLHGRRPARDCGCPANSARSSHRAASASCFCRNHLSGL